MSMMIRRHKKNSETITPQKENLTTFSEAKEIPSKEVAEETVAEEKPKRKGRKPKAQ